MLMLIRFYNLECFDSGDIFKVTLWGDSVSMFDKIFKKYKHAALEPNLTIFTSILVKQFQGSKTYHDISFQSTILVVSYSLLFHFNHSEFFCSQVSFWFNLQDPQQFISTSTFQKLLSSLKRPSMFLNYLIYLLMF
jgi:predicted amidophosphoribosyltransferase